MNVHTPITRPHAPKPISEHLRDLMARRRWSERDLAHRIADGAGIGVACALVRIMLSEIDCPLGWDEAALLARASNEAPQAWLARDAAWRAEGRGR